MKAIFHSSTLHDELDENENPEENQLIHFITINLTGLPELLLALQETIKDMASLFSSNKISGNGTLSCIPDEWSLSCHTTSFSFIPLQKNGGEWNDIIQKGRYNN